MRFPALPVPVVPTQLNRIPRGLPLFVYLKPGETLIGNDNAQGGQIPSYENSCPIRCRLLDFHTSRKLYGFGCSQGLLPGTQEGVPQFKADSSELSSNSSRNLFVQCENISCQRFSVDKYLISTSFSVTVGP